MLDTVVAPPKTELDVDSLHLGQWFDVEVENFIAIQNDRFKTRLVGALQGKYLIIEQPDTKRYGTMRNSIKDGQRLIVRTICEKSNGECIAFSTDIQGALKHPHRLYVVDFPHNVQTRELRSEKRVVTEIPCVMAPNNSGREIQCNIVDISEGGCRIECIVAETVKGIKQTHVTLSYRDEVSGEMVERRATVRSQRKQNRVLLLGMSFDDD